MQPRALGWKVSDEFVAPLCRIHHRAVHRVGDERGWWKQVGIDPIKIARKLWRNSRWNGSSPRPPELKPDRNLMAPAARHRHSQARYAFQSSSLRGAVSHRGWHRICRPHDRWTSRNLARSKHPSSFLVAAKTLRSHRCRRDAGAIRPALDLLEARAQFEAPQRAIYLRVAEHDGRNLFGSC